MSHFPCSYVGNKYKEFKKNYENHINLDGKKRIIECFGGSLASSFLLWKKHPELEYIVNDNNETIFKLYESIKNLTIDEFENKVNEKRKTVQTKEEWDKKRKLRVMDTDEFYYVVYYKFYNFRPEIFDIKSDKIKQDYKLTKLQIEFFDFLKSDNVSIHNEDWKVIFDKYKNESDSIFIFDPPYLMSCNEYYDTTGSNTNQNIYEFFAMNDNVKFECTIYFILGMNWIVDLLFRNHKIVHKYEKKYELSKKKVMHCLYEW
jgi:site-specific DNA-adenine methylase